MIRISGVLNLMWFGTRIRKHEFGINAVIAKLLIFAAGLLVGAGSILASNTGSEIGSQQTPAQSPPAVRSPLAVVDEGSEQAQSTAESGLVEVTDELLQPLINRIEQAEARISELELALASGTSPAPIDVEQSAGAEADSTDELLNAGFDPFTVDEIRSIRNEVQLQRLDLRDMATREGWVNSDRFRQALRELSRDSRLRDSLGDDNYDKLLLAEGRSNRVRIDSIIANSAADNAGVSNGDILFRYADERIFTFADLRSATTSGQRDEPVTIEVLRDGQSVQLVVPRGPLGVTISDTTGE